MPRPTLGCSAIEEDMIYLILGDKQKQSIAMSEKYRNQGDESEVDGRNSNQVNKDFRNNEDIIKLTQNGEEKFNQYEDETTSDNSDDKNGEVRFSQITLANMILR
jgi:hypothetical protein